MKALHQPPVTPLSVRYQPDEQTDILENPPRFTWMSARTEARYILQISLSEAFVEPLTYQPILLTMFTSSQPLMPGRYCWRYALLNESGQRETEWSAVRWFTLPEGLPITPLPDRSERYPAAPLAHPRLWLTLERLTDFRARLAQNAQFCHWDVFYESSVRPWLTREVIAEPAPYPNDKRTASAWRKAYTDCQEVLYAIRHMSVAGVILQRPDLLQRAQTWLLAVASWDTEGPTSRDYNDEAAFRVAAALAWGYDWLYDTLTVEERHTVDAALFRRIEQVADHAIRRSKIHQNPFDSHAIRSLSSVLVPCCLALLDEVPQARHWLDYTLEYYAALYPPWGGAEGGWAEGGMYWTTGIAVLIEALNLIKAFTGINFYQRPFFQKTGDFPLYCFSVDTIRASFGDQSNLGQRPPLKTGLNMRQFAAVTGQGEYQWYFEQSMTYNPQAYKKDPHWGWWDTRFDELLYWYDWPQIEASVPSSASSVRWFRDVGWVAFHHNLPDPDRHVMMLFKSSPYGSLSHSHADQNSIVLHAYGEPLLVESGTYVSYGSSMHRQWRRQTRSKNTLLINGIGQYGGDDKLLCLSACGDIEAVESTGQYHYARGSASNAYHHTVPSLRRYVREIYFVEDAYFVLVDQVDLAQAASIQWLLHALKPFTWQDQTFRLHGTKADLEGRFVYSSSGPLVMAQTDAFTGVDPAETQGLERQYHFTATSQSALSHRIVTLLVPTRQSETRSVIASVTFEGNLPDVTFLYRDSQFVI